LLRSPGSRLSMNFSTKCCFEFRFQYINIMQKSVNQRLMKQGATIKALITPPSIII
jgi:hypothetical protein